MRMWMVPPVEICISHLAGEHRELHMLLGVLTKKPDHSFDGYFRNNLLQLQSMKPRHDEVVAELEKRGYFKASTLTQHSTPFPEYTYPYWSPEVNVEAARWEMRNRCYACALLQAKTETWSGLRGLELDPYPKVQ